MYVIRILKRTVDRVSLAGRHIYYNHFKQRKSKLHYNLRSYFCNHLPVGLKHLFTQLVCFTQAIFIESIILQKFQKNNSNRQLEKKQKFLNFDLYKKSNQ